MCVTEMEQRFVPVRRLTESVQTCKTNMHTCMVSLQRLTEGLKEAESDFEFLTQDGGSYLLHEPKVYVDTMLKVQRLMAHISGARKADDRQKFEALIVHYNDKN